MTCPEMIAKASSSSLSRRVSKSRLFSDIFSFPFPSLPSRTSSSSSSCTSSSSHIMIMSVILAFSSLIILSTGSLVVGETTKNYYNPLAPLPRTERPTFIPCELAELSLGLMNLQGVKVPGVAYVPCTVARGVKFISGHYKRGMRMLMKSNRKYLSRNKFLNQLGSKTQKTAAAEPSVAAVAQKVATKVAVQVAKKVVSKLKIKKA